MEAGSPNRTSIDSAGYTYMVPRPASDGKAATPQTVALQPTNGTAADSRTPTTPETVSFVPNSHGRYLLQPAARLATPHIKRPVHLQVDVGEKAENKQSAQYENTPIAQEADSNDDENFADLLTKNDIPSHSTKTTNHSTLSRLSDSDDDDLPPPPAVAEKSFAKTSARVDVSNATSSTAPRRTAVKSAESTLYQPTQIGPRKSPGSNKQKPPTKKADKGILPPLLIFCIVSVVVMFFMAAFSLAASVYLYMKWPSESKLSCDCMVGSDLSIGKRTIFGDRRLFT